MVLDATTSGMPRATLGPALRRMLLFFGWSLALPLLSADGPRPLTPGSPAKATTAVAHGNCRLCHQSHPESRPMAAAQKKRAAAFQPSPVDAVCLACHQGPPSPQTDLGATKLPAWNGAGSSHVDGPFLDRTRAFGRVVDKGGRRSQVLKPQCSACHNVHAKDRATSLSTMAFDPQGKPMKARPANVAQICFGCHAGPEAARLSRSEPDLGALMRQGAASSHAPGATAAARSDLPSLRSGLFQGVLDCTSCHDNPSAAGPRGPHTSTFPRLLKANYGREGDVASTGSRGDDLCYTCHDRLSIQGNQSFPLHFQHVMGFTGVAPVKASQGRLPSWVAGGGKPTPRPSPLGAGTFSAGFGQPTPCATCHDPHGSAKNPALVAFDRAIVTRASVGVVEFQRTGLGHGNCTLSCHGYDHVQTRY